MLNKNEVEEPKCCCGCSVRTASIILGLLCVLQSYNNILSIFMAVVYFGVAFMNTSAWVKSTSTVVYIFAVLSFIGFIIWIILIVADPKRKYEVGGYPLNAKSLAISLFIDGAFNYYMSTVFAKYAEYLEHKEKEEARVVVNF